MGKSYKDLEVKYFAAEEEGQEKEEDQDLDELAMPRNNFVKQASCAKACSFTKR